jgi:tRNA1(Val) A37 N6-methylase TrmN6
LRAAFGEADGGADADFVMCNPPFFSCAEVLPT